jgi:Zn finger protein HypA/HybF involved in hydrogenase expression
MGTCAEFKCKCGYEAYGKWGIGMNPIYREQGISLTPALCRDCRELVNINENFVLLHCPRCKGIHVVLYSDPSLGQVRRKSVAKVRFVKKGPKSSDKAELEDYIEGVDTTVYLCPKCNRFTLEKSSCGLWD